MFKSTKVPLTPEQKRVVNTMIAIAYQKKGETYTTADLLKLINHRLTSNERRRVGRRFAAYVKKKKHTFTVIKTSGNNRYYTKP